MNKNIKAIIAALSASVMCAVPVAASFATTTATTSITAEAAGDRILDAALISTNGGTVVITEGAITYRITGTNTAELYGRYNQVSDVNMADQIRYNNRLYKVTYVRPRAFKNAHRTATGSGVTYFRCGKYVEEIGDQAFYESSVWDVDLSAATSLRIIGNEAFAYSSVGARANNPLVIPGGVTEIRSGAFRYNRWLEAVEFDGTSSNTIPLWIATNAFKDCDQLTRIYIYRKVIKNGWGSEDIDPTVLEGTPLTKGNVGGYTTAVNKFRKIFFPHN